MSQDILQARLRTFCVGNEVTTSIPELQKIIAIPGVQKLMQTETVKGRVFPNCWNVNPTAKVCT